jgi:hypothetical protein
MRLSRTFSLLFILFFTLPAIVVSAVQASTESVSIKPDDDFIRSLQLASGDQVSLTFKVLGPSPSTFRFSVLLPNGTTADYGTGNQGSVSFSTDIEGKCLLIFENSESSDVQLLTLDYNIEHFVLGLPMLLFVLVAIAVLLVIVVAGYIAMGKYGA